MSTEILTRESDVLEISTDGTKRRTTQRGFNCCREVFIFDDVVVKFEGTYSVLNQNVFEERFYNEILQDEDKKYFAKFLGTGEFCGEQFLMQETVFDAGEEATDGQMQVFEVLCNKYRLKDIALTRYATDRRNCALTAEGIKIYDLGCVGNPDYWNAD